MLAFITDQDELHKLYIKAVDERQQWQLDYRELERIANNDLPEDLDETLPEVTDGTLAAALYKLPKRIFKSTITGRAKAVDRDEPWLTELANMQWENEIIPNANSQAPFSRKWKDAIRKSAIYGSVPLITLFVENGKYTGADFIVGQPGDVSLEPGKVSDYDSDVIFWDVYLTDQQLDEMIEQAKEEVKLPTEESFNKWDVKALQDIRDGKLTEERDSRDEPTIRQNLPVTKGGHHFYVSWQRGVNAPFYMCYKATGQHVREWSNEDPSGDIPVHFLYCYQDFINPYGVGIVKLAGGTQNTIDYFRQIDVFATGLGFRPPISISGSTDGLDINSLVYAPDQPWILGSANVKREEINGQTYAQLPNRIAMLKTSLNQLIPVGDTSIPAGSGDPQYSRTPAGIKFQAASLSIDDDDYKDNVFVTYKAVAKNMINIHFANMQGKDLMKLSDEEREILMKSGLNFPLDANGNPSNELEVEWDKARAEFDFEIDPEDDKAKDDEKRLEGLLKVAQLRQSDPNFDAKLANSGKRINDGELYASIIDLTTDNDKILEDISPEDEAGAMGEGQMSGQEAQQPQQEAPNQPPESEQTIQAVMQQYGVDRSVAMAMLAAEEAGYSPEEIQQVIAGRQAAGVPNE